MGTALAQGNMIFHNGSSPIKVLYIEDEKTLQLSLSEVLSLLGYEMACADNGKLGVEKAKSRQPDLVLTDFCMPVMDGPEVIRRLRSDPGTAQIPVVVLSGCAGSDAREICRKVGADRFFAKPFDISEMDSAIQESLKHSL